MSDQSGDRIAGWVRFLAWVLLIAEAFVVVLVVNAWLTVETAWPPQLGILDLCLLPVYGYISALFLYCAVTGRAPRDWLFYGDPKR